MTQPFKTVSVIGLGYVGLPTAATLAARNVQVIGVDVRSDVVERINEGKTHIFEPDLDIIVQAVVSSGGLRATTRPEPADAFVVAVPTPLGPRNDPDMSMVDSAIAALAPVLQKGNLVIIESTSPVGTTLRAARQLQELRPDLTFPHTAPEGSDVMMTYCPERILPGQTLRELTDNARIIGGLDMRSAERARDLYGLFAKGEMLLAEATTAEMSKLTENAFRDVNIAFANELSMICDALKIDVWSVIALANRHPRVNILSPGPGVGGHCIPIDPWFIHHAVPERAPLIRTAREVNDGKAEFVVGRVAERASRLKDPVIAVLGLSYKPDVDDLRESPAVHIAQAIVTRGIGRVLAVEPNIEVLPRELAETGNVVLAPLAAAVEEADIVVVLVAHSQFLRIDRSVLVEKILIDTVGLLR